VPATDVTLDALAARAAATGRIAFDTEFMSEGRYFPRLCLVQVAAQGPDGRPLVATVDTLRDEDPGELARMIAAPGVEVVVHAGRQDLALVERAWGARATSVFDTQIAAALVSTSYQPSYQFLVDQFLGTSLKKSESFTRWDQRPLTAEQLAYARQDVEHLLQLAQALRERLQQTGRLAWALEECAVLEATSFEERDPEEVFMRLATAANLAPLEAAVARELVLWRERTAREHDRPIRTVLPDRLVTQLARRRPGTLEALRQERGVGEGIARRYGKQILVAIGRGERAAAIRLPPRLELPPWYGPLTVLCEAVLRARCEEQQLAPEMVATRTEIGEVVLETVQAGTEPAGNRLLSGWRRAAAGAEVLELLRGERSVRVAEGGRLKIDRALPGEASR
jgi:ribonuclease D